jgi:hypothetical protein
MKPTTKIGFTEPQIAFVMCAHPNCNLDHLSEWSFEFDQAGKIVDCIGAEAPVRYEQSRAGALPPAPRLPLADTAMPASPRSDPIEGGKFSSPEIPKAIWRKFGVAHRVLDVLVAQPSLQRSRCECWHFSWTA